jgi:hypothetical protein
LRSVGRFSAVAALRGAFALLLLAAAPAAAEPGPLHAASPALAALSPLELAARGDLLAQETAQQPAPETAEVTKAPGGKKALLLSLLLPGLGEFSQGEKGRATGFFVAEGLIWTHFAWFQVAGSKRKDNSIEQAQAHAGVGVSDADDDYWKNVGQYMTSQGTGPDAYEETLRREARDLYPSDPASQDAWVAERLPTGAQAWSWSSTDLRDSYQDTRESSRRAYDKSKYSIAAALANRILSAIDTQIIHMKRSKQRQQSARPDESIPGRPLLLLAGTAPDGSGRLYLTRSF